MWNYTSGAEHRLENKVFNELEYISKWRDVQPSNHFLLLIQVQIQQQPKQTNPDIPLPLHHLQFILDYAEEFLGSFVFMYYACLIPPSWKDVDAR